jgi:hypothetical protein
VTESESEDVEMSEGEDHEVSSLTFYCDYLSLKRSLLQEWSSSSESSESSEGSEYLEEEEEEEAAEDMEMGKSIALHS